MFALRRVLNQFNRTRTFDDSTLPELGSGAGGGGPEEGSGEELVGLATEARLTTPAPSKTPPAPPHAAGPALERKPQSVVNDIPERLSDKPAGSAGPPVAVSLSGVLQSNMWAQLEEVEGEMFSGNGPMELETHHNNLLGPLEPGQGPGGKPLGLGLSLEDEEDIFQAQGYLPFSPQTLRPPTTQTSRSTLPPPPPPLGPLSDFEGSGALPRPSNQTL